MVPEQRRTWTVVAVLVILGALALVGRRYWGGDRKIARDESLWHVSYSVSVPGDAVGVKIRASLPEGTAACRVVRESLTCTGLVADVLRDKQTGLRYAVATPIGQGDQRQLAVRLQVLLSRSAPPERAAAGPLSTALRHHYLRATKSIQVADARVQQVLGSLTGRTDRMGLLDRIHEHCGEGIDSAADAGGSDAATALAEGRATRLGKARAMVALCRAAKIPARLVAGFVVQAQDRAHPVVWLEAHTGKQWVPFDPEYGYARELPGSYLPVRRDGESLFWSPGDATLAPQYALYRARASAGAAGSRREQFWDILDLRGLPVGMQRTLAILLLLPVGALITAVWRNMIGLQTFGTFTPALLAMSFLYADWRMGGAVLVIVLLIGLGGRALLERLKLLMVPRLSIILTLAVLCVTGAVSALDYYGLTPSANAVILPLVVLTMLVERFHIRSEEDGLRSAVKLLGGTLLVGACCFAVLRWEQLGRLVLRYPELLLWVAAVLLLVGRYSGYRLTELVRFRDLAGPGEGGA